MVPGKNTARFRVREQLAGVSLPSDAVGTTQEISGTIVGKMDGSIVSSQSKFSVNMSTLKTDQAMRDGFIQRSTLQTDRFPYATFVPTQAPGFPVTLPADGNLSFKLIGDLTIRDVTKSVTWDVQGKATGDEATGTAKTNFNFAYFNLTIPSVARVLSIVDNIQLELDLDLKRAP
jgi:polyisoprenoid-binding protein YceI